MTERLRLAVPNKGRLLDATLALLHDAGLVFEASERSLVARVQNHPLDILFVRTNDIVEFVNDGVADAGITGGDVLAESGVRLPVLASLGYGRCRLVAAAPTDSPYQAIDDRGRGVPKRSSNAWQSRTRCRQQRQPTCRDRPNGGPSTRSARPRLRSARTHRPR